MSSRHGPNTRRLPLPTPPGGRWFRKRSASGTAGTVVQGTILGGMTKGGLGTWWFSVAVFVVQMYESRAR